MGPAFRTFCRGANLRVLVMEGQGPDAMKQVRDIFQSAFGNGSLPQHLREELDSIGEEPDIHVSSWGPEEA